MDFLDFYGYYGIQNPPFYYPSRSAVAGKVGIFLIGLRDYPYSIIRNLRNWWLFRDRCGVGDM
jgi:hypothetical protein